MCGGKVQSIFPPPKIWKEGAANVNNFSRLSAPAKNLYVIRSKKWEAERI